MGCIKLCKERNDFFNILNVELSFVPLTWGSARSSCVNLPPLSETLDKIRQIFFLKSLSRVTVVEILHADTSFSDMLGFVSVFVQISLTIWHDNRKRKMMEILLLADGQFIFYIDTFISKNAPTVIWKDKDCLFEPNRGILLNVTATQSDFCNKTEQESILDESMF